MHDQLDLLEAGSDSVMDGGFSQDIEAEVRDRYARGAEFAEPALCCPTTGYDPALLKVLPAEIIEKDYGCGDPSKYVNAGETVVDLGSGAGKICYILSQKVGPGGSVIGVDFNDAMLELARKYQHEVGKKLGYHNVRFVKARIQDLALDLDRVAEWLSQRPIRSVEELGELDAYFDHLRQSSPVIPNQAADVVVSNCVLNLVRPQDKRKLFDEIRRVLKRGGRAVISDIVCDEDPAPAILADPKLWSGCISGAFREDRFLEMFEEAGFYGVEILSRAEEPWQVIDGVEFRSLTVRAFVGKEGPCVERNQAVVYRGPWKQVKDDDGHTILRGQRMAVCDKTFRLMTNPAGPYAGQMIGISPRQAVDLDQAKPFACGAARTRDPRETKGLDYRETQEGDGTACCPADGFCC